VRTVRSLVWITGGLVARPAGAHHPGGTEGWSWLWLLLGIVCLLAGVAAWAFLGAEDADQSAEPRDGAPEG
jgi:amino acid transporter